jgi:Mrp family chromosome partitioning ATPase
MFGVGDQKGLVDALADKSMDVESLVISTDVPGLSILPAGTPSAGATELLASARMAEITQRLLAADPRRLVLLDSSPLLVTSESRELVKFVGQVLLVVRAGKTPKRAILDAIQLLGEQVAIGLVLNQGRPSLLDGLYGYGYGYGAYGDYGDQPPAPAA